jgi:hypothetical protein
MSGSDFNKSIRQFKLTNGDEIVCDVVEWPDVDDDHNGLVVRNSYKIFMLNTLNPTENRYYQFRPWLVYQDKKDYFQVLNADHIIAEATPADELLVHYYRIINDVEETESDLENNISRLEKVLKEFMDDNTFSDSDSGNLIKFPGKKLH